MGKNYYCEYCDKRMKNDLDMRKKHMEGLPHKIAKMEYLTLYKNPKELLEQETAKIPCERFHSGKECKFSLYCHFSHYTQEQLEELNFLVLRAQKQNSKRANVLQESSENCEISQVVLWKFPRKFARETQSDLPCSLQPIALNKIGSKTIQWGLI